MEQITKDRIVALIESYVLRLGSAEKVATKCGVSPSIISQMRKGGYSDYPETWARIGAELGLNDSSWQLCDTYNQRMMHSVLDAAKSKSMFMAIAHPAGGGKSASIKSYESLYALTGVFVIRAVEWSAKMFLQSLCKELGIAEPHGYVSVHGYMEKVVSFFKERVNYKPLLVIDEADKLRPSALRTLITLYNELEDQIGVVIAGTDNLEVEITRGVRYNRKGFDEIHSRFGRKFIALVGATLADVRAICAANGVTDAKKQKAIFESCKPIQATLDNQFVMVVADLRPVKRAVMRELLLNPVAVA